MQTLQDSIALWDEQMMIGAVRMLAKQRQGWDVINEHWMDGDILELLSEANFDLPKALDDIQNLIDIKNRFTQSK
jgi:hypothetical protein